MRAQNTNHRVLSFFHLVTLAEVRIRRSSTLTFAYSMVLIAHFLLLLGASLHTHHPFYAIGAHSTLHPSYLYHPFGSEPALLLFMVLRGTLQIPH